MKTAFVAASPRIARVRTPLASFMVHGAVLFLWIGLTAQALGATGLGAWAAGVFYVLYDSLLIALVFVWNVRSSRRRAVAPSQPLTLTVLIAAHNEAESLPRTLGALLSQTSPADRIIIADDGSTDDTSSALRVFGLSQPPEGQIAESVTQPALAWLRRQHRGKAHVLNAALAYIDTDLIVTVDADTLLAPDALDAFRRAFAEDPRLVAATGVLHPLCAPTVQGRFLQFFQTYEYVRNFLSRRAWAHVDGLLLISGALARFRRTSLMTVGGFDPACMVEDYELIHRLRRYSTEHQLGWTTAVLGEARATTEAPGTLAAFIRQRRRWFSGFLQTQLWYRDMVANPRFGAVGLIMLPIKAVDTLQPIFGLAAFALFALGMARSHGSFLPSVGAIVVCKFALDFAFTAWSIMTFRRWAGATHVTLFGAILAILCEPFGFQLLRHLGAAAGWVAFLTGQRVWGRQTRRGDRPTPPRAIVDGALDSAM